MSLIIYFDRAIHRIKLAYTKRVFKSKIKCTHNDFHLVGNMHLINTNIVLGHNVEIYPEVMFFGDGKIIIGDNVSIGNGTIIYSSKDGGVTIGTNTMIAAYCYIIDCDHGTSKDELMCKKRNNVAPINIGNDVWLATGVKVLKGVNISTGSVIGANAVVDKDTKAYSISVGVPAKMIKYRSSETN